MVPDIVKRALVTKRFSGKCRSTGGGPLHLVDVEGVAGRDITAADARTGAKRICHEGIAQLGLMRVSARF